MVNVDVHIGAGREEILPFARRVVATVREENVPFMAGSIAYQAFVSLLPLLVLLFFAISLVGDQALAGRVVSFSKEFLPTHAATLLGKSISQESGTAGASLIGLVTLVWGTLKVFRGLNTAFSELYGTTSRSSFLSRIVDGIVVFAVMTGVVLATSVGVTAISVVPLPADGVMVPLILIGVLVLAFYPMYARFPNLDLSRREILPGVVVAAIGWATLQAVFGLYVELAGGSNRAGVIGAVILLLTWLYFGAFVLLVGATVNAIIVDRREPTTTGEDTSGRSRDEPGRSRGTPQSDGGYPTGCPAGLRVNRRPPTDPLNRTEAGTSS